MAPPIAPRVAAIMGSELGWDEARAGARGGVVPGDRPTRVLGGPGRERSWRSRHPAVTAYPARADHDVHRCASCRPRRGLVYELRLPIAIGGVSLTVVALVFAYRLGWFAAARRHPVRAGALALVGPGGVGAGRRSTRSRRCSSGRRSSKGPRSRIALAPAAVRRVRDPDDGPDATSRTSSARRAADPGADRFAHAIRSVMSSRPACSAGTDEFHFGSGDAHRSSRRPRAGTSFGSRTSRSATARTCSSTCRRTADGYADDALELGRLKATDGSFNYVLPAGTDPVRLRQRTDLVQAVLPPVRGRDVDGRLTARPGRSAELGFRAMQRSDERVPSRLENAMEGSVAA